MNVPYPDHPQPPSPLPHTRFESPNPPLPPVALYRSGARLLRLGLVILGVATLAVLVLIVTTVFKQEHRDPEQHDTREAANTIKSARTISTKSKVSDELLSDAEARKLDEVDRVLGHGMNPRHVMALAEPPAPPPAPPKPAPPAPANAKSADEVFRQRLKFSEEELRKKLYAVPELRLIGDLDIQHFLELKAQEERMVRVQADYPFAVKLSETIRLAAVQAGLTVQSGRNCFLDPQAASVMQLVSKDLRNMGFVSVPGTAVPGQTSTSISGVVISSTGVTINSTPTGTSLAKSSPREKYEAFQQWCDLNSVEKYRGALATLLQMLQIEDAPVRLVLVRELAKVSSPAATSVLALRAVVDLSPEVRQAAVEELKKRPAAQYVPVLLQGLRYPWPPIADQTAAVLRILKPKDSAAKLVELLDRPDPSAPFRDRRTGKTVVRELVRLNHMRNCLLCHAPSAGTNDGLVRGAVPVPGKPLPSIYYSSVDNGFGFVRADVTFMRQDFSVVLDDKSSAPWPEEQRFDFVTRVRPARPDEMAEIAGNPGTYPQRDAVLYALRGLTGKDGGDSSTKWRDLLGITAAKKENPGVSKEAAPKADALRQP